MVAIRWWLFSVPCLQRNGGSVSPFVLGGYFRWQLVRIEMGGHGVSLEGAGRTISSGAGPFVFAFLPSDLAAGLSTQLNRDTTGPGILATYS